MTSIERLSEKVKQNFWNHVNKTEGCWEWTGALNRMGYGTLSTHPGRMTAHRVAWELVVGPIPSGLFVCHHCDNRKCVRPDHLFVGTAADNMADMVAKDRQAKGDKQGLRLHPESRAFGDKNGSRRHPECLKRGDENGSRKYPERLKRGDENGSRLHPEKLSRGEEVNTAKLTEADVMAIREEWIPHVVSQKRLAKRYGVHLSTIQRALYGQTWKHLPTMIGEL
jgi:hypothetical protein